MAKFALPKSALDADGKEVLLGSKPNADQIQASGHLRFEKIFLLLNTVASMSHLIAQTSLSPS